MSSNGFTLHRTWTRYATIGFLGATNSKVWSGFVEAFDQRLRELGWIDGYNIAISYAWANGQQNEYAKIAKNFVRQGVDIIVTSGTAPALAAKKATPSIPIVFAAAGDPIHTKLVASLAHPGRNVTGLSNGQTKLAAKRLDQFRKVVPDLKTLAIIGNRGSSNIPLEMEEVKKAARRRKIDAVICDVRREAQIAPAIKRLKGKVDGLYVCTDPFITTNEVGLNTAAASVGLPTMHAFREYVDEAGGLMSYGPDFRAMFSSAADLVDKILRGKKPADIPVKLQKKCEQHFNPHTAKVLGLTIPKRLRRRGK